jgi:hypothetical protein
VELIVPEVVLQVTEVFEVPVTLATNCCVPPVVNDVELGEIATAIVEVVGCATVMYAIAEPLLPLLAQALTVIL